MAELERKDGVSDKLPASFKPSPVSNVARFLGASGAGMAEIAIFHPVDTIGKRLMANQARVFEPKSSWAENQARISSVIFRHAANEGGTKRFISLYNGLSYGVYYKISQRVYKFGGQPVVTDYLQLHHAKTFANLFGEKYAKSMMHATAGAMVGVGEVVLMPFDLLKVKGQTNPGDLKGRSMWEIFRSEGIWKLYRGASWMALRNAPGSFAMFGGAAFTKEKLFKLEDLNKSTVAQNFVASVVGSITCIMVANPTDVVKTRVQNRDFNNPETGLSIVRNMLRKEGPSAFFKGIVPKTLIIGPKLVFSFTLAQSLITYLNDAIVRKNR